MGGGGRGLLALIAEVVWAGMGWVDGTLDRLGLVGGAKQRRLVVVVGALAWPWHLDLGIDVSALDGCAAVPVWLAVLSRSHTQGVCGVCRICARVCTICTNVCVCALVMFFLCVLSSILLRLSTGLA